MCHGILLLQQGLRTGLLLEQTYRDNQGQALGYSFAWPAWPYNYLIAINAPCGIFPPLRTLICTTTLVISLRRSTYSCVGYFRLLLDYFSTAANSQSILAARITHNRIRASYSLEAMLLPLLYTCLVSSILLLLFSRARCWFKQANLRKIAGPPRQSLWMGDHNSHLLSQECWLTSCRKSGPGF